MHIASDISTTYYISIHNILIFIASLTCIKFTYEYNSTLTFQDILLIRNTNKLEFKVYRKHTCKNDHKNVYSHHKNNTKRGIIIGFYLTALRICSSKYLNGVFIHIENSFLKLQ